MNATETRIEMSAAQTRINEQAARLADLLEDAGLQLTSAGQGIPIQLALSDRGWLPLVMERLSHELQALFGRAIADESFDTKNIGADAGSILDYRVHISPDAPPIIFPALELLFTSCCKSVLGLSHERELAPGSLSGVTVELNEIDWERPLPVIAGETIRQWQGSTYPVQQSGA